MCSATDGRHYRSGNGKIDKIIAKIESDPETEEVKATELNLWKKIRNKTLAGRRTGLGTTAEGDMLAAMGFRYGTPEATAFSVSVHKTLALAAYWSSVEMAKERGAFSLYDAKREEANPYINRLKDADPSLYDEMIKYGRRNIACLTIAPTGTTSLMTQTTSGIEPVFMPVYKRRRKVNPNEPGVHVDYVDETGDAFEEYVVYHHKFISWMDANGIKRKEKFSQEELDELVAKSPYNKATANDIDWHEKVKMQGEIQKWVDHSISVTINLPSDVTEDLINELYMEAWKAGCKGCTVYRDGSRSGVLVSTQKEKRRWRLLSTQVLRSAMCLNDRLNWRRMLSGSRTTKRNGLRLSDLSMEDLMKYLLVLQMMKMASSVRNL